MWRPHLALRPWLAEVMGLVIAADDVVAQLEAAKCDRRRESWHQGCGDQWATGGRRLDAWLRSPPQVAPPPERSGTAPPGTPRAQERAWHAIWARPAGLAAQRRWGDGQALDALPHAPAPGSVWRRPGGDSGTHAGRARSRCRWLAAQPYPGVDARDVLIARRILRARRVLGPVAQGDRPESCMPTGPCLVCLCACPSVWDRWCVQSQSTLLYARG